MKNVNEVASEATQVILPNRYETEFVNAYQAVTGNEVPKRSKDERRATIQSAGVTYRWTRGRSIPSVVAVVSEVKPATRTVGLTGSEWCKEYDLGTFLSGKRDMSVDWARLTESKLGMVALIAPNKLDASVMRWRERRMQLIPVVTAYPNVVTMLGVSGQYNVTPKVVVEGGVESVADALDMPAVDLVCGGGTILRNNFQIVSPLFDVYPALVCAASELRRRDGGV